MALDRIAVRREHLRRALIRLHVGPAIAARVLRLNPDPEPCLVLRGLHRKKTCRKERFLHDVCTRADFDARWGRGASRRLEPSDFINAGGKRRWIKALAFVCGPITLAS